MHERKSDSHKISRFCIKFPFHFYLFLILLYTNPILYRKKKKTDPVLIDILAPLSSLASHSSYNFKQKNFGSETPNDRKTIDKKFTNVSMQYRRMMLLYGTYLNNIVFSFCYAKLTYKYFL